MRYRTPGFPEPAHCAAPLVVGTGGLAVKPPPATARNPSIDEYAEGVVSLGRYLNPPPGLNCWAMRKSTGALPADVRKSPVCGLMPQALRPETAQPLESVLMPNIALKAPLAGTSLLLRNA